MDLSTWFFTFIGFASIVLLMIFLRIPLLSGALRFVLALTGNHYSTRVYFDNLYGLGICSY